MRRGGGQEGRQAVGWVGCRTVPQESRITPKVDMPKWVKYGLRALARHYLVGLRRNFEFGLSQVQ